MFLTYLGVCLLTLGSHYVPVVFSFPIKDLCERHEKGVLHKHQRALHKYSMMKKQMMSATVQNKEPESVEQLESRIVEVEQAPGRAKGGTGLCNGAAL